MSDRLASDLEHALNTREIWLTGKKGAGLRALVDEDDYEFLSQWRWHLSKEGYARRTTRKHELVGGRSQAVFLHRVVLGIPIGAGKDEFQVDHINCDTLDNRKANLRVVSGSQNQWNKRSRVGSASRFKGVTLISKTGRWQASIKTNGQSRWLGNYIREEDAARAYNEAASELWGEYARPNPV